MCRPTHGPITQHKEQRTRLDGSGIFENTQLRDEVWWKMKNLEYVHEFWILPSVDWSEALWVWSSHGVKRVTYKIKTNQKPVIRFDRLRDWVYVLPFWWAKLQVISLNVYIILQSVITYLWSSQRLSIIKQETKWLGIVLWAAQRLFKTYSPVVFTTVVTS